MNIWKLIIMQLTRVVTQRALFCLIIFKKELNKI